MYQLIIEYYTKDKLITISKLEKVVDADLFWQNFKANFKADNGFVSIGKYAICSKCVRYYDYSISKLIKVKK